MVRVKRGNVARNRRKKILSLASGYRGAHSVLFRIANQQVMKALKYSYIDRKQKKRNFRKIWINRLNAASRSNNVLYNQLVYNLKNSNININRKMLSQIAVLDNLTFSCLLFDSKFNKHNLESLYTS
jgi:large subunit ribosomal protein L20